MSALDDVKKLRTEANEVNQIEKIWEALEIVAAAVDEAPSKGAAAAESNLGRTIRGLL